MLGKLRGGLGRPPSTRATRRLRDAPSMPSTHLERSGATTAPLQSEQSFPSARFEWKRVKMSGAPQASVGRSSKTRPFRRLPRISPRKPLHATIKLRGGVECWVEIHARGSVLRVPGTEAIYDVLRTLCNDA